MALSWLDKQILRINPKAIEKRRYWKKGDEAISYSLQHGYEVSASSISHTEFLKYPSYIQRCLELKTPEILTSMSSSHRFSTIPKNLQGQVVQAYIDSDLILEDGIFFSDEFSKNPTLWLKTAKQNPNLINSLRPISDLDIPELEKGKFMNEFMKMGIPFEDISWADKRSEEIIRMYLDTEPVSVHQYLESSYLKAEELELAKEQFLSNLDRNMQYVTEFKKHLGSRVRFTEEEKNKIVESAIRQNYSVKGNDYEFLIENPEVVYQTVMNMEGKFDSELRRAFQNLHKNVFQEIEDDDKKVALGKKLVELNYNFYYEGTSPMGYINDSSIAQGVISENPFYINEMGDIWGNADEILSNLDNNDYIVTRDSPSIIFMNQNVQLFLRDFENNFEEVVQNPKLDRLYFTQRSLELQRKIYEIYKQNRAEIIIDKNTPAIFKTNPYLVRDAIRARSIANISDITDILNNVSNLGAVSEEVRNYLVNNPEVDIKELSERARGTLFNGRNTTDLDTPELLSSSSSYFLGQNKEFVLQSARKYFPSLLNTLLTIEDFSKEEQQEISKLYFEYMDKMPKEIPALFANDTGCILRNPYILLEQVNRGETYLFMDASDNLTDEQKQTLAEDYLKNNGAVFTEETPEIYLINPYLIDEIIRENPKAYDFVRGESSNGIDYDLEQIKKAWKEGRYEITDTTPRKILKDKEVFEYCIENNLMPIARNAYFDSDDLVLERVRKKYIEGIRNGSFIPDEKSFQNLYSEFSYGNVKETQAAILELVKINPQFIDNLGISTYDGLQPEVQSILVQAIRDGSYVQSENTPEVLLKDKTVGQYLGPKIEDNSRIPQTVSRVKRLNRVLNSVSSVEELRERLERLEIDANLEADDPEKIRANTEFAMLAIEKDFSNVEKLSPIINFNEEQANWLARKASENLAAVQSLISECKEKGKQTIYVLGDMIGFGPQSNECIDALREASQGIDIKCILGNHELYSLMGNNNFRDSYGFDPTLTTQIRSELSPENRAFLEGLPISRKLIVEGKNVELTHFPAKNSYTKDQDMFVEHGESFLESPSGKGQDYLIYGHEHGTESTTGNDIGTVLETQNGQTLYINLPSSGCVHGKNTSYVTMEMVDGKLQPEVHAVSYDQEKTKEALKRTNNPKGHFFGAGGLDGR